jgi:hypothetical protein
MALFTFIAGLNHFRNRDCRKSFRLISEIQSTKSHQRFSRNHSIALLMYSCAVPLWRLGVIALLIAIFPTHLYMYFNERRVWAQMVLLLRMPLQLFLIFGRTNIPNPVQSLLNPEPLILDLPDAEIIYYSQFFDTEVFFAQLTRDIPGSKMILEYLEKIHPQPRFDRFIWK